MAENSISLAVAERMKSIAPAITDKVVEVMVDREVKKRSDALVVVIDMITKQEKELAKINKPDVVSYNGDGTPATQNYSKQRLDDIAKAKKKLEKMVGAVNKALGDKADFGDIYNFSQGKEPADDAAGSAPKED